MCDDALALVDPTETLRDAFIDYMHDFESAGEALGRPDERKKVLTDFAAYVRQQHDHAKGAGLPDGFVPANTYWLVRDGRVLGRSGLRHRLTPALRIMGGHIGYVVRPSERRKGYGTRLLAMTLQKARQLALQRVMVTCDEDNIASARIIVTNGGRFESKGPDDRGVVVQRYWIDL